MTAVITPPGVPASRWRHVLASANLDVLDVLDLPSQPARVLVVSPHPDDETLAVGATIHRLVAHGVPVEVLAVTDGEAAVPWWEPPARLALAGRRVREQTQALAELQVPAAARRLGVPDGGVQAHQAEVQAAVSRWLSDGRPATPGLPPGPSLVLAPWEDDPHPDHAASGRAALRAVASCLVSTGPASHLGARAAREPRVVLLGYPVWLWHRYDPADERVPWARLRRGAGARADHAAKARAIARYVSQVEPGPDHRPVLPAGVLEHFAGPEHLLVPAPAAVHRGRTGPR